MSDTTADEVRTGADVPGRAGETVVVRGTYIELDVRKAQTDPPLYKGHAALRLADGTLVLLLAPSEPDALRPQSEREELRGAEAVAEGMLHEVCPGEGARLELPCLSPLLYVVAPDLHDLLHRR